MTKVVVLDTEYLSAAGTMGRFWSGPGDPDPNLVQIGAVLLDIADQARILDQINILIAPVDRAGKPCQLDPYFTDLTGITNQDIATHGLPLAQGLAQFESFSQGANCWSWGKDELIMIAVSCFVSGISPPMRIGRFGNVKDLFVKAGVPLADINRLSSGALSQHFGVIHDALHHHNALDDALSISYTLQHLLKTGRLSADDFSG